MMTPAKWHHHHAMRGPSSVPLLLALALVLPSLALALPLPRSPSSSTATTASASASRSSGRDGARHDRALLRLPLQGVTRRRRRLRGCRESTDGHEALPRPWEADPQ